MSYTVSVKEAADYLGVDQTMVRGLLSRGWLRGSKVERVWRIDLDTLQDFYTGVSGTTGWTSDPGGELALARSGQCPACAGPFEPVKGSSELAREFLACPECRFSVHESVTRRSADLSPKVAEHGTHLQRLEQDGLIARGLLMRRRFTLDRMRRQSV